MKKRGHHYKCYKNSKNHKIISSTPLPQKMYQLKWKGQILWKTWSIKIDSGRNRRIAVQPIKEIKILIKIFKNLPTRKTLDPDNSLVMVSTHKKEITPILHKTLSEMKNERTYPHSFYEICITLYLKPVKDNVSKKIIDQWTLWA